MEHSYIIMDKSGRILKKGNLAEEEVRMVAKAGFRVFEGEKEITPILTGLFDRNQDLL
ncbi:MAG TPA: hypothetical protein VHR42_01770 [Clostridia bacterium]|nr:hypothetical protein [Clostridia bacterium]